MFSSHKVCTDRIFNQPPCCPGKAARQGGSFCAVRPLLKNVRGRILMGMRVTQQNANQRETRDKEALCLEKSYPIRINLLRCIRIWTSVLSIDMHMFNRRDDSPFDETKVAQTHKLIPLIFPLSLDRSIGSRGSSSVRQLIQLRVSKPLIQNMRYPYIK